MKSFREEAATTFPLYASSQLPLFVVPGGVCPPSVPVGVVVVLHAVKNRSVNAKKSANSFFINDVPPFIYFSGKT